MASDTDSSGEDYPSGSTSSNPCHQRHPNSLQPSSSASLQYGSNYGGRYRNGSSSPSTTRQQLAPRQFNPKPHLVTIVKSETGFGFNCEGASERGRAAEIDQRGAVRPSATRLRLVLPGGAAEKAGLLKGDRILEVYVWIPLE